MDKTIEVALLSMNSSFSEKEKDEFIGLFLGFSEECFDFEENPNAPWYYHPQEPWPDYIPNLLAWVYITLPDSQKPPFALLYATMQHCVEKMGNFQIDGMFLKLDYFTDSMHSRTLIPYKANDNSRRGSLIQPFRSLTFPDVRGESYYYNYADDDDTLRETIRVRLELLDDNNMDLIAKKFAIFINHYDRVLQVSSVSPVAKTNDPVEGIATLEFNVCAGEWSGMTAGRILRTLFQALNLSRGYSPIVVTMTNEVSA